MAGTCCEIQSAKFHRATYRNNMPELKGDYTMSKAMKIRFSVPLSDDTYQWLGKIATERGSTRAQVAREILLREQRRQAIVKPIKTT